MDRPRIRVDFNEMLEPDVVLLSKTDSKEDSSGQSIELFSGKKIDIYDDCGDVNAQGEMCKLLASGVVVENNSGIEWTKWAKWLCKLEGDIEHSFDLNIIK